MRRDFPNAVIEINNPDQLVLLRKVVIPASMGGPDELPPAIGKYKNVVLYYEKTTEVYLYSSDGIPTAIGGDLSEILARLDSLEEYSETETAEREEADNNLQEQIETIRAASDVVDIVGTYQDLLNYDTSKLGENDIIRVLVDSTHDGATSYYRWVSGEWVFIGAMGPFYTQEELDQMFDDEADARETGDSALSSSINSLSSSLSAETTARQQADTTLQGNIDTEASARQTADTNLHAEIVAEANARSQADAEIEQAWQTEATTRGTADQALQTAIDNEALARTTADTALGNRITAVENGLVSEHDAWTAADTALQSAVNNKQDQLTAGTGIDITNNVISATSTGPTVVQTTGTSQTNVMSQNAVTGMIFADPTVTHRVRIASTQTVGDHSTTIGEIAQGYGAGSTALGWGTRVYGDGGVGIGREVDNLNTSYKGTIAIGAYSGTGIAASGMMDIGTRDTTYGYNSSKYRLLTGLYDPQNNHDAATKGYVDAAVPTKTSDLTNDSDFQTSTDVATAVNAVETKLNGDVMTDLAMATDATKVEFTETKKNLSTGVTSTEVDTIPLASTTQAGILNAAGYQSIIDSQDRLDALAGGAVSIANLSANPSQSDLTTAWQTATGETTVFNRASIFDSTNGKNWTYFDNTSAWEVTGTVNQSITINNFSQGTAGLIVGDNTAGKVYAEQDGTGSVYGWDALDTRVTNVETATANIPSVVQTTGASTTDVMSQNAVTSMVFNNATNTASVVIGRESSSTGAGWSRSVVIGDDSRNTGANGVAIGYYAKATHNYSVALGAGSKTTANGQLSLEKSATFYGHNNTVYTLLSGLYDPQNDHDAATKGYVDTAVASAGGAAEINATDWSALWQ